MPKRVIDQFDLEAEREGSAIRNSFVMKKARSRRQTKEHAKTSKGNTVVENRAAGKYLIR